MTRLTSIAGLLVALLCSASARAHEREGADAPQLESLEALLDESVVTTATRAPERASTAPATVFSITAEDMRAFGIRSVDEALAYLGVGMHVQKARDYNAGLDVGAQGIMLRDYGRHLLVLLDGHVMNSQATGQVSLHEAIGVPIEAIDHIEVMLGAGSVVYGSNAMTAVVQITTKTAERDHGEHVVSELSVAPPSAADGYARSPRGQNDLGYHYRVGVGSAHSTTLGRFPASIAVRAEWQQDLSQTYALRPATGDDYQLRATESAWGGVASHGMKAPSGTATLRVGDFRLQFQGVHYERTMPLVALFDDQDARERRQAARVDLAHSLLLSQKVRLQSRVYADMMVGQERSTWISENWCLPGQVDGCSYRSRNIGRWVGAEQQLSYTLRADGSLSLSGGYDVRFRDARGRTAEYRDLEGGASTDTPKPRYHAQSVLAAVFAQLLYAPSDWLSLNLGGRLDVDSDFGARLSPRAAVVVTPLSGTSLRASYAEAFRSPSALELNQSDLTYVIPPARLGAEVVRSAELDWQQRIQKLSFSLRGFASFYSDLIAARSATPGEVDRALRRGELVGTADPSYVTTNDNVTQIRAYGGSFTVQVKPVEGLTLAGSTTVSRSFTTAETLTLWPRAFGNARVSYAFRKGGPTVGLAALYARGRRVFSDFDADTALVQNPYARGQIDLRLTVSSPVERLPGLSVRAGVGARFLPDQPYLLTTPTTSSPATPVQYIHDLPQLHLLLGANYDF